MHSHQNCIIQKETMYYLGYIVPSNHIDAFVTTSPQIAWRLTGLYGHPDDQCKHETWSLLRHLKNRATLPWVCMGDSNEILSSNEKNGRLPKPLGLMQNFRNALLNCGLVDLGYNGRIFTWRNGREDDAFVEEKLDWAYATVEWRELFPMVKLSHLCVSYSDHDPILLETKPTVTQRS